MIHCLILSGISALSVAAGWFLDLENSWTNAITSDFIVDLCLLYAVVAVFYFCLVGP
ncbi:hypothetical protein DSUL_50139 [Desulfovibrionales bacterium]